MSELRLSEGVVRCVLRLRHINAPSSFDRMSYLKHYHQLDERNLSLVELFYIFPNL